MWGSDPAFTERLFGDVIANGLDKWEVWAAEGEDAKILGVALWCPPGAGFE
jgi:hypothetical protein